jgi:hypothetical protein
VRMFEFVVDGWIAEVKVPKPLGVLLLVSTIPSCGEWSWSTGRFKILFAGYVTEK